MQDSISYFNFISFPGGDGVDYNFLLKGHEDLRQDERVMQLFGLVNALLSTDQACSRKNLRYVLTLKTVQFFDVTETVFIVTRVKMLQNVF